MSTIHVNVRTIIDFINVAAAEHYSRYVMVWRRLRSVLLRFKATSYNHYIAKRTVAHRQRWNFRTIFGG